MKKLLTLLTLLFMFVSCSAGHIIGSYPQSPNHISSKSTSPEPNILGIYCNYEPLNYIRYEFTEYNYYRLITTSDVFVYEWKKENAKYYHKLWDDPRARWESFNFTYIDNDTIMINGSKFVRKK